MQLASPSGSRAPVRIYRGRHIFGPNGLTGLSRSTIYHQIKDGKFPAPVPIGDQAVGWPSDVIDQWLAARASSAPTLRAAAGGAHHG